jgi:hypothetical protein
MMYRVGTTAGTSRAAPKVRLGARASKQRSTHCVFSCGLLLGRWQNCVSRLSGELQNGHPGAGAIHRIDESAIVVLDVVVHRGVETIGDAIDG